MTSAAPSIDPTADSDRAGALLTIDLDAVAENYRRLGAALRPGAQCAGVVKADGYGCGAVKVAKRLFAEGCRVFFVARANEGFALKPHLPGAEVCVLDGLLPGLVADYASAGVVPVLNDPGQVEAWTSYCYANDLRVPVILHVDTGMNRLGMSPAEANTIADDPGALRAFTDVLVMSHLVVSEEPEHPANAAQLAAFAAPLLTAPQHPTNAELKTLYGARSAADLYYADWFAARGAGLTLTTEGGSAGERGRITAPLARALGDSGADITIYTCGPTPMMRAVAELGARFGRAVYASLEPVMGCGMGGCYSCVVPVKHGAGHHFVRSCIEGPVFDCETLVWDALPAGH